MEPHDTGRLYDSIAPWWLAHEHSITGGLTAIRRAGQLARTKARAFDVGCGSGRAFNAILEAGFSVTGIDVSAALLEQARQRYPQCMLIHADICTWPVTGTYDLIIAWDSIFHVPHCQQSALTEKLCHALGPGGVLLFTGGGIDGEIYGEMQGRRFYYSSLADDHILRIVNGAGCRCVLMERDQHPENHTVYMIVKL